MKKNKDDFVKLYQDNINQVVNQDAVRVAAIAKEHADGTLDGLIKEQVYMACVAYEEALNQGFDDDKAFMIGCYQAGYLGSN